MVGSDANPAAATPILQGVALVAAGRRDLRSSPMMIAISGQRRHQRGSLAKSLETERSHARRQLRAMHRDRRRTAEVDDLNPTRARVMDDGCLDLAPCVLHGGGLLRSCCRHAHGFSARPPSLARCWCRSGQRREQPREAWITDKRAANPGHAYGFKPTVSKKGPDRSQSEARQFRCALTVTARGWDRSAGTVEIVDMSTPVL